MEGFKGFLIEFENWKYLWWEEGDDGGEVGDETKESEAGEDHSLAPELKLLPNLVLIYFIGYLDISIYLEFLIYLKKGEDHSLAPELKLLPHLVSICDISMDCI